MKNFFFLVISLTAFLSRAAIVVMPRVEARLFINEPQTDFDSIFINQPEILEKSVAWLFEADKLSHDLTKSLDLSFEFPKYWRIFKDKWHLVDMNNDGQPELLFSGQPYAGDEKEMFSIYAQFGSIWKEMYWDDGHLLAYKIHPRTKEVLLYHHRYPCCSQSTHAIIRLRFLKNKIYQTKRYFLARDSGMKGQFFPDKSKFKPNYGQLKKNSMMYWSNDKIMDQASLFVKTNEIIHYPKGSIFKILAIEDKWMYVMMITPPVNETSPVVNAANLTTAKYFGWIEKI